MRQQACDLWARSGSVPPLPFSLDERGFPRVVEEKPHGLSLILSERSGVAAIVCGQ